MNIPGAYKLVIIDNYTNNQNQQQPPKVQGYEKNTYTNISQNLKELEKSVTSPTSSVAKSINSINTLISSRLFNTTSYEATRAMESYRTSEHLIYGGGSYAKSHSDAFLNSIRENSGTNFKKLASEYEKMIYLDTEEMLKGNFSGWTDKIHTRLNQLNPGESVWIESTSHYGRHAMIMRIEKREDSFILHFANTGGGIQHEKFHPREVREDGMTSICLVARLENIPLDTLLKGDFIEALGKILVMQRTQNNDQTSKRSYDSKAIGTVYSLLQILQNVKGVTLNATRHEENWGRPQLSGSCVASGVWAMARTYLSSDEQHQLEVNMQVKSLIKHYKEIESGNDTSSTRKIIVLDLIQSLKSEFSGDDLLLLKNIENALKFSLKMHNAEFKISDASRVEIDPFIRKGKDGFFELVSFRPIFSKDNADLDVQNSILKANVKIEKNLNVGIYYKVKKNDEGQWRGEDLNAKIALTCFHIANGDHEQTTACMQDLIKELSRPQPQANFNTNEPFERDLNTPEYFEQRDISILLRDLSTELYKLDNTRSGIAKQIFLATLSIKLMCTHNKMDFAKLKDELWKVDSYNNDTIKYKISKIKNYGYVTDVDTVPIKPFIQIKNLYGSLKIEEYLDSDNIWIQGLDSIDGRPPNINRPAPAPSPTNTNDHHLSELLEAKPDTEESTNQVALQALQQNSRAGL